MRILRAIAICFLTLAATYGSCLVLGYLDSIPRGARPLFSEWEAGDHSMMSGWRSHGRDFDSVGACIYIDRPINYVLVLGPDAGFDGLEYIGPGSAQLPFEFGGGTVIANPNEFLLVTGTDNMITLPLPVGAASQVENWISKIAELNIVVQIQDILAPADKARLQEFLKTNWNSPTQGVEKSNTSKR